MASKVNAAGSRRHTMSLSGYNLRRALCNMYVRMYAGAFIIHNAEVNVTCDAGDRRRLAWEVAPAMYTIPLNNAV